MTHNTISDAVTMQGGAEGALLANRYRIVRQLGQGGMGSVWLAEDTQLDGKLFAIKMLPSILVSNKWAYRQLKDEALVAMKLTHPNIVTLRAFEENNGNPFLVMDYIDGQTLDDYLAEHGGGNLTQSRREAESQRGLGNGFGGGLPEEDVVRILKPIAAALDYAHGEGVVHRDVKPANVMIRKDGHPFILDFGIAREIQETMTRVTGKLSSGTLLYMSPEQLHGAQPKPAQDVYSFAAMVYECLKGEPPFSRGQIEYQIDNDPPPSLMGRVARTTAESGRDVSVASPSIAVSVMAGLAKKPEGRPSTCTAVLQANGPRRVATCAEATVAKEHVEHMEGDGRPGRSRPTDARATSMKSPPVAREDPVAPPSKTVGARSQPSPILRSVNPRDHLEGSRSGANLQDTKRVFLDKEPMGNFGRNQPFGQSCVPLKRAARYKFGIVGTLIALFAAVIVVIATCMVYHMSPTIYEAKSEFTMDMRRTQTNGNGIGQMGEPDYGNSYEEIFNTRLSDWRSDKIVGKIISQYRANYPASTVTDAELIETLGGSKLELVRHSRLITIVVRSRTPALAAALANAYAEAIESLTDDENKLRCDKAVAQIHDSVEKQRRVDEKVSKQLLDFRTANKIDNMNSEREILQQSLQKTATDILTLQSKITTATEWEKVLESAQKTPENFGSLPTNMPYSSEIRGSYTRLQTAKMELTALLARFTKIHPEVRIKEKELETFKQQFLDAVPRALATVHGNLASYKNQLAVLQNRNDKLRGDLAAIEQKIITADAGLKLLEQEKQMSSTLYTNLLKKENEARIAAEANNEIVRVGRPALAPSEPILPNLKIIFGVGAVLLAIIAFLFVCSARISQTEEDE